MRLLRICGATVVALFLAASGQAAGTTTAHLAGGTFEPAPYETVDTEPAQANWVRPKEDGVNVRTNPYLNATIVGQIQRSDRLRVAGEPVTGDTVSHICGTPTVSALWWPVHYGGHVRYVTVLCVNPEQ